MINGLGLHREKQAQAKSINTLYRHTVSHRGYLSKLLPYSDMFEIRVTINSQDYDPILPAPGSRAEFIVNPDYTPEKPQIYYGVVSNIPLANKKGISCSGVVRRRPEYGGG